jgi:hypothetical protein
MSTEHQRDQEGVSCVTSKSDPAGIQSQNKRFFEAIDLKTPLAEGIALSVGIRNSNDKSFPRGFCIVNRTILTRPLRCTRPSLLCNLRWMAERFYGNVSEKQPTWKNGRRSTIHSKWNH